MIPSALLPAPQSNGGWGQCRQTMSSRIANPAALRRNSPSSLLRLIEQDTLRPGHRVPSVRRMSLQRGVSISTVLQAYTVLENRGYLEARPQSGYYVRPRPLLSVPGAPHGPAHGPARLCRPEAT
jgi:DNA-binding transcriptional MocR family regulator